MVQGSIQVARGGEIAVGQSSIHAALQLWAEQLAAHQPVPASQTFLSMSRRQSNGSTLAKPADCIVGEPNTNTNIRISPRN